MKDLSQEEWQEKFENFLFNLDECLENIIDKANIQGYKFDYSLNSLNDMESYIIKNKTTVNDDDYNDLAAYLGEVLRLKYGGKWICNLDKVNNSLYYGFPVIEGHSIPDVLFSPFHLIKAFILRKKTNLFHEAIESQVNPQPIDWSKFPTEN